MTKQIFDLGDKTALITGAAGLLGIEHARALVSSHAEVILLDISSTGLESAFARLKAEYTDARITPINIDITCESSIRTCALSLLSKNIFPDILINNASVNPSVTSQGLNQQSSSRLENFSLDEWNTHINVGLTGAFLCTKHFGPLLIKNQASSIINISSDLSVIAPDQRLYKQDNLLPNQQPVKPIPYSVVKTGLIGLTRYVAAYWAKCGLRCNAVSPGGVFVDQSPNFVSAISELIPMGRMAKRDEYHGIIQFLSSDKSAYLTGQNIVVDGGRTII